MKPLMIISLSLLTMACSQGIASNMIDRTSLPCGNKPNCVSTQETREKFTVAPFILRPGVTIEQIERIALTLPGAEVVEKTNDYLRIECTTRVLRFVDDLELKLEHDQLKVRSESRVGYSDFGVNRRRVETLRQKMNDAGLLQ